MDSNEESKFIKDLTQLLNFYSVEDKSNTQDFVLAQYLVDCLHAYEKVVNKRDYLLGYDDEEKI